MSDSNTDTITAFDYKQYAEATLKALRRDRDRQIIARRFGFGLQKRQTLEKIGRDFGITRERVRQIEKAAITKIKDNLPEEVKTASQMLASYIDKEGQICLSADLAAKVGADTPGEAAYIVFLATLAPDLELIDEDDSLRQAVGRLPKFNRRAVKELEDELLRAVKQVGKPSTLNKISAKMTTQLDQTTLGNLARINKQLANLDTKWGLITWPEVNPKSIRDKTYLVLGKHGRPLHFADIATHIDKFSKRSVTVQAVHNELIKDPRFILIGRGIYALAEWGYTPGTVADIIVEVLRGESPLHKDEIVRRVLLKRQVKTTTIILNLQEKEQFVRVAKATYKLDNQ